LRAGVPRAPDARIHRLHGAWRPFRYRTGADYSLPAQSFALQRLAAPCLRALALETGDWLFFSVLQGFEAICLSRESGDIPIPPSALKLGDRHPLGIGAGGLALLAALPDEEVEAALAFNANVIAKNFPRSPVKMIWQLIGETREKGYSVIPGIVVPDYWAIGVPVFRPDGRPIAAIVLVASAARLHVTRRVVLGERLLRLSRDLMSKAEPGSDA
jgi:DNA-binding IclR family transcriptional regulator